MQSIADMKDLQFGFQATTTGGDYITDEIQPEKQPREFTTLGAATQALANGQIDAFLMDVAIGAEIVKERGDEIDMTGQFQTNEQYGVLFEKGNPLRTEVNKAIEKLRADGTLKELQAKWFRVARTCPSSSSAPDVRDRLRHPDRAAAGRVRRGHRARHGAGAARDAATR